MIRKSYAINHLNEIISSKWFAILDQFIVRHVAAKKPLPYFIHYHLYFFKISYQNQTSFLNRKPLCGKCVWLEGNQYRHIKVRRSFHTFNVWYVIWMIRSHKLKCWNFFWKHIICKGICSLHEKYVFEKIIIICFCTPCDVRTI